MIPALARDHHVITFDLLGSRRLGEAARRATGWRSRRAASAPRWTAWSVRRCTDHRPLRWAVVVGTALVELRRPLAPRSVILDSGSGNDVVEGDTFLGCTYTERSRLRVHRAPSRRGSVRAGRSGEVDPPRRARRHDPRGLEPAFADGFDVPDRFVDDVTGHDLQSYDDSRVDADATGEAQSAAAEDLSATRTRCSAGPLMTSARRTTIADPKSGRRYRVVPARAHDVRLGRGRPRPTSRSRPRRARRCELPAEPATS